MRRNLKRIAWLVFLISGTVFGNPVSITAFGEGSTRSEAIVAARRNAVEEALASRSGLQPAERYLIGSVDRFIVRSRVLSVENLGSARYEALVEAEVDFPPVLPARAPKQRVTVVPDSTQLADPVTADLIGLSRASLESSPLIRWVDVHGPSAVSAIQAIRFGKAVSPIDAAKRRPEVDVLCVITSEVVRRPKDNPSTLEGMDLKVKWAAYDLRMGRVQQVKWLKTSIAGSALDSQSMQVQRASEEVTRVTNDLALIAQTELARDLTRVVKIPITGVLLTSGESVVVYQVTSLGSVRVALGQVMSVGAKFATISADVDLPRRHNYAVKPSGSIGRRGVILDSDW